MVPWLGHALGLLALIPTTAGLPPSVEPPQTMFIKPPVISALAALTLSSLLAAQGTWTELGLGASPSSRRLSCMSQSPAGGLILLDGSESSANPHDTWLWVFDQAVQAWGWRLASPIHQPPARQESAMALDERRSMTVVFGGRAHGTQILFNDTWGWGGTDWTSLHPGGTNAPTPRQASAMAYDRARGTIVLFGGVDIQNAYLSDTWTWDGSTWTLRTTTGPTSRWHHAMAYDEARGRVILYGGSNLGTTFDDTWAWDGLQWTQVTPSTQPPPLRGHAMTSDPVRQRIVMAGGESTTGAPSNFTWDWNGRDWTAIAIASPPARGYPVMGYEPTSRQIVMFGGQDLTTGNLLADTWAYSAGPPASYRSIGSGCPGSSTGIPALVALGLPIAGNTFLLRVSGAPPISVGALLVSATPTAFDLGAIGAPGCTAYANPHVTLPLLTDFNGEWRGPIGGIPIPNQASLVGAGFWNQIVLGDRAANLLGIITTNGGEGIIGY